MNSIFTRRSIRRYKEQDISGELIEKIIKAGMAAPSAGDEQPWQFIVIKDKNILNEIHKFHPYSLMLREANCAIVVCGDLSLERMEGFWVQDCSAAAQNMLLMANELGLGSVWLGVYPVEDRVKSLKGLLELPESVIPLTVLPLGYPAERKKPAERFDSTRIHTNKW